jgi:hypothetical protein
LSRFLGETCMGGENQRASLIHFRAILYAPFIGNPVYLPPIRSLIEIICRNYRGGSIRIGAKTAQKHVENSPPRNSMQFSIYRGGIDNFSRASSQIGQCLCCLAFLLSENDVECLLTKDAVFHVLIRCMAVALNEAYTFLPTFKPSSSIACFVTNAERPLSMYTL